MREYMWKYILYINPLCQWKDYYFYCPYIWFSLNKPFRMENSFTTILMIKIQIIFLPWKISLMVSCLPRFVFSAIKILDFTGRKIILLFLNEHLWGIKLRALTTRKKNDWEMCQFLVCILKQYTTFFLSFFVLLIVMLITCFFFVLPSLTLFLYCRIYFFL